MMNHPLLAELNAMQQAAVSAKPCHALVIAGAGSGKTRVLVHRIAWLIQVEGVSPADIFSVTFTNKAAATMRQRVESLLHHAIGSMWIGTFHSLSHRLLRIHPEQAGLPENFQIIDQDDQLKLISQIHKQLSLDDTKWPPKKSQWFINHHKDEGLYPADIVIKDNNPWTTRYRSVYSAYNEHCERSGLVDFAELLLRAHALLKNNPDILNHYQQRFRHILVDEFQDTNTIQYHWLRLLAGEKAHVMAVGDDDQSIYSWRGARMDNMFNFTKDFANAHTIRLEQNYRSTGNILKAANTVIAHNAERLGKDLWTEGNDGELIALYAAFNETDEARFISDQIQTWVREGHLYADVAILYRSNAQSRVLEERLIYANIPYRVYGGQKFFERSEIKDVLAYLRLLVNRHDDSAFLRIINTPTRGIGETTLTTLRQYAQKNKLSLWKASEELTLFAVSDASPTQEQEQEQERGLSNRASHFLKAFIQLIHHLDTQCQALPLEDQAQYVLDKSGLTQHFAKDRTEKGLSRVENCQELVTAMQQFRTTQNAEATLGVYLAHIALNSSGEDKAESEGDAAPRNDVQLMTLHAAKGLEFPLVFLVGMEEGLFPHKMSSHHPQQLEEERRLCYVGMTRAMKKLVLTYAEQRYVYGRLSIQQASRFLQEIPDDLWMGKQMEQQKTLSPNNSGPRVGQQVRHPKFGEGIVLNHEGSSAHARVQVKFAREGVKWLILSYANLEVL